MVFPYWWSQREKMLSCGERTDGFGKMDKAARGGERSNILEWKVRVDKFFLEKRKEKERNAPLKRGLTNDGERMEGDPNGGRGLFLLFLPLPWL